MTDISAEAVERLISEVPGVKDTAQQVWNLQERVFATLRVQFTRIAELEAEVARLKEATRPFSAAVFNDNGDVTISTGHLKRSDWLKLHNVLREKPHE